MDQLPHMAQVCVSKYVTPTVQSVGVRFILFDQLEFD